MAAASQAVSRLERNYWSNLTQASKTAKKLVADLSHRDEVELAVAEVVAGILQGYQAKVQILDPSIPPSQLDNLDRDLAAVLLLALMTVFKTEATKIATQLELSTINIEQAAREWAYNKTVKIVRDFRAKTLEILQKARLKQKQLDQTALLALILNPIRAVSLASTQVTTAASAGELSQLKANKAQPKPIVVDPVTGVMTQGPTTTTETYWRTRNDSNVCSICGPLNNKPEDVWGKVYPDGPGSAHPNCRCYLETEIK